jgi:hypothetical protein
MAPEKLLRRIEKQQAGDASIRHDTPPACSGG